MDEQNQTFDSVQDRLAEIVDEVKAEGISLDEALALYEEAVKLGLSACDLSEQDIETVLEISSDADEADDAEDADDADGTVSVDEAVVADAVLPDDADDAERIDEHEPNL